MKKFLQKLRKMLSPNIFKPSVRWTLVSLNLFLLLLLIVGLVSISYRQSCFVYDEIIQEVSQSLDEKQKSHTSAMLHCLSVNASQMIGEYHFSFLNELLEHLAAEDVEMLYMMVVDNNGKVFSHSSPSFVGQLLEGPLDNQLLETLKNEFPEYINGEEEGEGHFSRFVDLPDESGKIINREAFHPIYIAGKKWGMLRCRLNLAGMTTEFIGATREWEDKIQKMRNSELLIVVLVFFLGIIASSLVVQNVVRALREMNNAVSCVAEGKLDVILSNRDMKFKEFSQLVDSFNVMTLKLKVSHDQLDEYGKDLAQKVKDRTKELEEAQDALLKKAHEAGMAEMAVGILHNIGNAITPAKIGNMVLLRQLKKSTLPDDLKIAVSEIQTALEYPDKLSADESQRLISIAKLLPETIREVQSSYCSEVEKIYEKLAHIESIINLQMRYARLHEPIEQVELNVLVNDALKMLQESIDNRRITVVKKLDESLPPALIQKGKLMQIIINLIKNAYEAMAENYEAERILELSTNVDASNPRFVRFTIKDTGIGFLEENKEKLFQYGYTTKSFGSGFGLHSCANFLIANKGEIEAMSDGPGKGAMFIVKLPTIDYSEHDSDIDFKNHAKT